MSKDRVCFIGNEWYLCFIKENSLGSKFSANIWKFRVSKQKQKPNTYIHARTSMYTHTRAHAHKPKKQKKLKNFHLDVYQYKDIKKSKSTLFTNIPGQRLKRP